MDRFEHVTRERIVVLHGLNVMNLDVQRVVEILQVARNLDESSFPAAAKLGRRGIVRQQHAQLLTSHFFSAPHDFGPTLSYIVPFLCHPS